MASADSLYVDSDDDDLPKDVGVVERPALRCASSLWSGYSIEMCQFILVGEECPRRGRGCGYAHTQEERTLA